MGKNDLLKVLKNPRDQLLAIDMDGVLCHGIWWGEKEDPVPNKKMIDKMWEWYKKGAHLIIYTGRQPIYYPETLAWLIKHKVPFHGIAMFTKIGADLYVDDMALHISDVL